MGAQHGTSSLWTIDIWRRMAGILPEDGVVGEWVGWMSGWADSIGWVLAACSLWLAGKQPVHASWSQGAGGGVGHHRWLQQADTHHTHSHDWQQHASPQPFPTTSKHVTITTFVHKKDKVYNATHHNKLRKRSSTTRYIYIHIYI